MSLLVGLTGGIASGKSTAARIFRELGAHLIDADEVARDIVAPHSPAWDGIVAAFGEGILRENGELDRAMLATLIFADDARRRLLEGITHPPILAEISRQVDERRREFPDQTIIVDAALMIESGSYRKYDRLIVVFTDEETQARRLMARDGIDRDEAERRIAAQMPLTKKVDYADYVIDNSGGEDAIRDEVERVYGELKEGRP